MLRYIICLPLFFVFQWIISTGQTDLLHQKVRNNFFQKLPPNKQVYNIAQLMLRKQKMQRLQKRIVNIFQKAKQAE
ncbi:MAG: hypothetical protein WDZ41_00820 [Candidatus Babeliales bacterium]